MDSSLGFNYYERGDWQLPSQPINGPSNKQDPWRPVVHYTAATSGVNSDSAQFLRNMQNSYLNNQGFSVGYWAYIDRMGYAWQIRGPHPANRQTFNPAANLGRLVGYPPDNGNLGSAPILFAHGINEPIEQAAINTAKKLWAYWGLEGRPVPHSDMDPTGCPGDLARAQIANGDLDIGVEPEPTPPPTPPPGDTMLVLIKFDQGPELFANNGGSYTHITAEHRDYLMAQGVPRLQSNNADAYQSALKQAGT